MNDELRHNVPHTRWGIRFHGTNDWLGDHGIVGPAQHARLWGSLTDCTEAVAAIPAGGIPPVIESVTVWTPFTREVK